MRFGPFGTMVGKLLFLLIEEHRNENESERVTNIGSLPKEKGSDSFLSFSYLLAYIVTITRLSSF
jgi:hypothetical protein